jgi:AcrR family transcriptional regulator
MTNTESSAGVRRHRSRLTADDVRARMFAAAKEIIRAQGVTISLEEIRLDEVVHRAGVPRSSAYRLWPYKGDFVNDLLMNFAGPDWMGTAAFDPETLLLATDVVLRHWSRLETVDGRRAVILEAVRLAVARNISTIIDSVDWEIYVALVATGRGNSNDDTRQVLTAQLERAEVSFISLMTDFYAAMSDTLGFGLRDPAISFRHLAVAGSAVVEGLALRKVLVDANANNGQQMSAEWSLADLLDTPVPGPAIEGGVAEWTFAAWAFLGVFDAVTELVSDWEPTDDKRAALEELQRQARLATVAAAQS